MRSIVQTTCLIAAVFACRSASAEIRRVQWNAMGADNGTSWMNAYPDLQMALADADPLDEIWIAAGTYKPGTLPGDTFSIPNLVEVYGGFQGTNHPTLPNGETQRSERDFVNNVTILSGDLGSNDTAEFENYGDNSQTLVTFAPGSDEDTVIDGLTICGANGTAIVAHLNVLAQLRNLIVRDNLSIGGSGAGLSITNDSSPVIQFSRFTHNKAQAGAAILISSGCFPEVADCTFDDNAVEAPAPPLQVDGASGGGAVLVNSFQSPNQSPTSFRRCTFTGNSADHCDGGAIHKKGDLWLLQCSFYQNVAYGGGVRGGNGGAFFGVNAPLRMYNCDFESNQALVPWPPGENQPAGGGAWWNSKDFDANVSNCRFFDNETTGAGKGGAICAYLNMHRASNVTVVGNRAPQFAGMFVQNADTTEGISVDYANSIFWGNTSTDTVPPPIADAQVFFKPGNYTITDTVVHSCVQDDQIDANHFPGNCNIDDDPEFVDQGGGNLRLMRISPCIDTGGIPHPKWTRG